MPRFCDSLVITSAGWTGLPRSLDCRKALVRVFFPGAWTDSLQSAFPQSARTEHDCRWRNLLTGEFVLVAQFGYDNREEVMRSSAESESSSTCCSSSSSWRSTHLLLSVICRAGRCRAKLCPVEISRYWCILSRRRRRLSFYLETNGLNERYLAG